jgi:hypothetical protein
MMEKEICTISIGNGIVDDDYTFYEDGKIKRFYDRNSFSYNLTEWVEVEEIFDVKKAKLIEKCDPQFIVRIRGFLS